MAGTRTKLSGDWVLLVSTGTDFKLQCREGTAEITFESSLPASTDDGVMLQRGEGVDQSYGTGNCYGRSISGWVAVLT